MNPSSSSVHGDVQSAEGDHMDDWLYLAADSVGPQVLDLSREDEAAEDRGKLKSKLVSAWNRIKYGWFLKQKSNFSKSSPVMMLGHTYLLCYQGETKRFRKSFETLLWLTYRRGFPQLGGQSLTTDSGWGCVLRTGQMLLAQGLIQHTGWTWSPSQPAVKDDLELRKRRPSANASNRKRSLDSLLDNGMDKPRLMVSWFGDHPRAPFGVHKLVELGKSSGKKAGDWYGPSIVAHILRKAVAASGKVYNLNLAVYVAQDCTIYLEDVKRMCAPLSGSSAGTGQPWKSVIILVPVRLGGQDLNPAYIACVKKLLALQCCIGIIGGKPRHSLFFVGFQDDHLLYLDPHYCQPTVDTTPEDFPQESFHCKYPRKMPFTRMDPSCTIGFYAKGQKDFESLRSDVNVALYPTAEKYPMFIFAEGHGLEDEEGSTPPNDIIHILRRRANTSSSMDEFVLL